MQYKYMTEVNHPLIRKVKNEYKRGLKLLLQARDVIIEACFNHFCTLTSCARWGVFSEEQIVNANLNSPFEEYQRSIKPHQVWNIKKQNKELHYDWIPGKVFERFTKREFDFSHPTLHLDTKSYIIE